MKKWLVVFSIISLALFFGGCSSASDDETEIESLITDLSAYFAVNDYSGEDTIVAVKEAINTVAWYRELTEVDKAWNYTFDWHGEDTAYVDFDRDVEGILHLFTIDSTEYTKNFDDTFYRYAIFVKDTVAEYHGGWRLFALSPAEVKTDGCSMLIDSVIVSWSDGRLVIDDINKPIHKDEIPVIYSGDTIKVTVYATAGNMVYLHSFGHRWFMEESNPGVSGIYERVYFAPAPGIYRVGIDMLTKETLYDDTAPYSSYGWVFPYIVEESE